MHLEQLQAILEVASTGSISAAARNLAINQPSLSRTIKAIEKELNVTFFERTPTGVQLTSVGEHLLPFVSQIIHDMHLLSKEAFRTSADTCPEITEPLLVHIVTSPIILDSLLSPALAELAEAFPQIQVNVNLIDAQNPNDLLNLPDYELFIGNNIAHALDQSLNELQTIKHTQIESLFTENFQLIMHYHHPLSQNKNIALEEALQYPLILHDNGFSSNEFYQQYLDTPMEMTVLFKSNNPRSIAETLRNTQALFLTTDFFSQNDYAHQTDLCNRPMRNLQVEYFCLYQKEHATQCAIKEILSILKFVHAKMKS